MARNPTWNQDELILALDLYLRSGFLDDRHPDVIELSVLNRLAASAPTPTFRNPNGVSTKLGNLRSLDPSHPGALPATGRGDVAVWEEFSNEIRGRALSMSRSSYSVPSYLIIDVAHAALTTAEEAPGILDNLVTPSDSPFLGIYLAFSENRSSNVVLFQLA